MKLYAANLTPFTANGEIASAALDRHTRWMRSEGVDGFCPTGTTGEFLYLTDSEKRNVHEIVIDAAEGAVVPCVWCPSPVQMRALARGAELCGARAVFLPPPLYQPVSDDAIVAWYASVSEVVSIPVWAYHHPRTHNPLDAPLIERLIAEAGVSAMKDSSGDPERVRALARRFPGFVWAGGDHLLGMALGPIAGHISRLANVHPAECARFVAERVAGAGPLIESAGGIPQMKAALDMGCRAPVT